MSHLNQLTKKAKPLRLAALLTTSVIVTVIIIGALSFYRNDLRRRQFSSLLVSSVRHRRYDQVKSLLACGADPNVVARKSGAVVYDIDPPWHQWLEQVMSRRHSVDEDAYPIIFSADATSAKILLDFGADPDPVEWSLGETPLMENACDGNYDLVKVLVDGGANTNRVDKYGRSVLAWAYGGDSSFARPSKRAINYLLAHGAR